MQLDGLDVSDCFVRVLDVIRHLMGGTHLRCEPLRDLLVF
jgi:hypothetical protein